LVDLLVDRMDCSRVVLLVNGLAALLARFVAALSVVMWVVMSVHEMVAMLV
jgi:hypothetical protein